MLTAGVVMPAYNEADSIERYVSELDSHIHGKYAYLRWWLIDDASTDGTDAVLDGIRAELGHRVMVVHNERNLGHGPAVLRGYEMALGSDVELVIQVDGDGHYHATAISGLIRELANDADAVRGVRTGRQDPWFRIVISIILKAYVRLVFGVWGSDPNIGLRGYRRNVLERSLRWLRKPCRLPNLYLSIATEKLGFRCCEIPVVHRRRPGRLNSTTFQTTSRSWLPPLKLLATSLACLWETMSYRYRLQEIQALGSEQA